MKIRDYNFFNTPTNIYFMYLPKGGPPHYLISGIGHLIKLFEITLMKFYRIIVKYS